MLLLSVIAGGQTEARATIIIDHYSPFDQGFRAVSFRNNTERQPLNSEALHRASCRHDLHQGNRRYIIFTLETNYINK